MKDDYDLSKLVSGKKRKINSKNKGNTFQRKLASILNTHFNTSEFCPTPGSGAFATTHKLPEYLKIYGDLITPKNFKYSIEAKKGYNKENISSIFNSKSIFREFIIQATRDSINSNKPFLLVLMQDRAKILCLFEKEIDDYIPGTWIQITIDKKVYIVCDLMLLLQEKPYSYFFNS